jgi:cysteine desulfurase/selenocysteine lyase
MNNNLDLKKYFPIFSTNNVVFLDSAASTQKPLAVIDAEADCYQNHYANIHRSSYKLALAATTAYENTRTAVRKFINANSSQEIIFTKSATESINLTAYSYGENFIHKDDEIVITICEHHSNFIPWQRLAKKQMAKLKICYLDENQDFSLSEFQSLLTDKTKLVCVTHLANGLGLELPVKKIVELTRRHTSAKILVDGAQIVAHQKIDVQDLDCDFFVFSAHKIYGPSGVGVLYAKENLLNAMPPFLTGGEMVKEVSVAETTFNELPYKFEAGTSNIAGVIAFKTALEFLNSVGLDKIAAHEKILIKQLEDELTTISGLKILGAKDKHHSLLCFVMDNISPYDLATFLDNQGVAIRVGHHCAQPLINFLGYESSSRISLGCYNTEEDIAKVVSAIRAAQKFFS